MSSPASSHSEGATHINVLYATVTGTAQDAAEKFGREARRRHWLCRVRDVADLDGDWSAILGPEPLVFFVSTTGQGALPPSLVQLWRFLVRSDLPSDLCSDLPLAVFGLGDTTYSKFCWPAKKIHRRLIQLGATSLVPRGEGDEQDYVGIDTALTPWIESVWPTIDDIIPRDDPSIISADICPDSRIRLIPANEPSGASELSLHPSNDVPNCDSTGALKATLTKNERVTPSDHFQDTRICDFEFEDPVKYEPGDVLSLRPANSPEDVDNLIKLLKWEDIADLPYFIQANSEDVHFPSHFPAKNNSTTLRHLLTYHLDAFSVPRRTFFEWLTFFTTNIDEKEKCMEFCSEDGQQDFYSYATRPRRTMYEVLTEFRSSEIPPNYIADLFPEMRSRQFSIASSNKENDRKIRILVAVVKYQTLIKAPRRGVCTNWLKGLKTGAKVYTSIELGTMRPPPSPSTPVILIGPGTGIAPFRSLVRERVLEGGQDNVIFFGCRSVKKDYYFKVEWDEFVGQQKVVLYVAASRDQDRKIYVQQRLRENADQVWRLIEAGAYIYISGSANAMPKAVRKALIDIIKEHASLEHEAGEHEETKGENEDLNDPGIESNSRRRQITEAEAEKWLDQLESSGRLQEETWS